MDSLAFVLQVAEETSAILNDGTNAFRENPALPSLLAVGGSLVSIGNAFTEIIGRTFVWDTAAAGYQPDDARGDAPSGGARFILYQADNRAVSLPLTETGYVDVVPEAGGHRVRIVAGVTTTLDFFSWGTIADTTYQLPCCSAVLGRFPRNLSATGTAWLWSLGEMAASFSYADTITASVVPGYPVDLVSDVRRLHLSLPGGRMADFRSEVFSSIRFSDSDNFVDLRVAYPVQPTEDSVVVSVALRGVRGYLEPDLITINGQDDLLVYSKCQVGANSLLPCYRYRGTPIDTVQIQMFDEALQSTGSMMRRPAYASFWILEAILAPAILVLR